MNYNNLRKSLNLSFDWDMQLSLVTNEILTLDQVWTIFIISNFYLNDWSVLKVYYSLIFQSVVSPWLQWNKYEQSIWQESSLMWYCGEKSQNFQFFKNQLQCYFKNSSEIYFSGKNIEKCRTWLLKIINQRYLSIKTL